MASNEQQQINGSDLQALESAAMRAAATALVERAEFARRWGYTFGDKRNVDKALGYQDVIRPVDYRKRYERGDIAERIVEAYPRGTWSGGAIVTEDPDPANTTEFEKAAQALFDRLGFWSKLLRADILAGLGRYSVIYIGTADADLKSELTSLGADDILHLNPLSEERAVITKWVEKPQDPRFGLPEMYKLKLGSPREEGEGASFATHRDVHHSRVVHIVEDALDNDVFGKPRLRAVWNRLDDLQKIVGGGAEATWRLMDPGMQFNLDPEAKLPPDEEKKLKEQIEKYVHGIDRYMTTVGLDINQLNSTVPGFAGNAELIMKLVSATLGIPMRILTGSERGELASSQDRSNWAERIFERRHDHAEPLVRRILDDWTMKGALPKPPDGYEISWQEIDELNESEKAEVTASIATANKAQKEAEGRIIMTSDEIRDKVYRLDALEEVQEDPEAEVEIEEELRAAAAHERPETDAVLAVVDNHTTRMEQAFYAAFKAARESVNLDELEEALARGDKKHAEDLLAGVMEDFGEYLDGELPPRVTAAMLGVRL